MNVMLALTIGLKLAELAVQAARGVNAAAEAYATIHPIVARMVEENREPTAAEWRALNALLNEAVDHLLQD